MNRCSQTEPWQKHFAAAVINFLIYCPVNTDGTVPKLCLTSAVVSTFDTRIESRATFMLAPQECLDRKLSHQNRGNEMSMPEHNVGGWQVGDAEGCQTDVLLGSEQGLMTRISLDNVALHKGRAGKGTRLMKLKDGDTLQTVTPILVPAVQP